jgi:hypothetical protein
MIAQQFRLNKNLSGITKIDLLLASTDGQVSLSTTDVRIYIVLCDEDGKPAKSDYSPTPNSWFNYNVHQAHGLYWIPSTTYTIGESLQKVTFNCVADPNSYIDLKAGVNYLLLIMPTPNSNIDKLTVGLSGDDKIVDGRRFLLTQDNTVEPNTNIEGNIDLAFRRLLIRLAK